MVNYIKYLFKYPWILLLTIIIGIISGIAISNFKIESIYDATSTIYIYILNDENTKKSLEELNLTNNPESTYQSLQSSEMLVSDFIYMIKSSTILNDLEKEFKTADIYSNTTITQQPDTRIIDITVKNEDKETAVKIADTLAEEFKAKTHKILNLDTVNIIGDADNNVHENKKSKYYTIFISTFLGLFTGLFIIYLISFYKLGYRQLATS
jgi:capsular polysaccharide biosynthesis protein